MRTDERAGQAAKSELQFIKDKLQRDASAHPEGHAIRLRPEQRLDLWSKADLLSRICGIT
jgi:hypothetical protein